MRGRGLSCIITLNLFMDAELQKLVDSGKLTTAGAETLEQLKPGTFCLHKSWGFGRVASWNLLLNQVLIDFEKKKAHPMQPQYAADNLTPIPAEHFLARKATDLPALKIELKENAAAVMRNILQSLGGKATQAQISSWLVGDVFSEPEFKRWWEATKKLIKKEGDFLDPDKKNRPDRAPCRTGRSCAGVARVLQAGPPAERADFGTRPDHQVSSRIQRTREAATAFD